MKILNSKILIIYFLFLHIVSAQIELIEEPNCVEGYNPEVYTNQIGGYALPSEGTINALIVFVQFPDDNYDQKNPYWKKGYAPANMNYWINETWSSNPIQGSLTHYFNEMSFNKLKFIGKTVSVITPNSRQWYLTNSKDRGYIHKEVIQQLDNTWNFAEFDKWDLISAYNHTDDRTDGVIEMIIMVWRNVAKEFPEPQQNNIYTALDFHPVYSYGSLGGSEFQVDGGARTVKTGFSPSGSTPGGSGVTINDHLINQGLTITIHEFAHYLMGG